MIDREHVFGLRNEAGEGCGGYCGGAAERREAASTREGFHGTVGLGGCAGRIGEDDSRGE